MLLEKPYLKHVTGTIRDATAPIPDDGLDVPPVRIGAGTKLLFNWSVYFCADFGTPMFGRVYGILLFSYFILICFHSYIFSLLYYKEQTIVYFIKQLW